MTDDGFFDLSEFQSDSLPLPDFSWVTELQSSSSSSSSSPDSPLPTTNRLFPDPPRNIFRRNFFIHDWTPEEFRKMDDFVEHRSKRKRISEKELLAAAASMNPTPSKRQKSAAAEDTPSKTLPKLKVPNSKLPFPDFRTEVENYFDSIQARVVKRTTTPSMIQTAIAQFDLYITRLKKEAARIGQTLISKKLIYSDFLEKLDSQWKVSDSVKQKARQVIQEQGSQPLGKKDADFLVMSADCNAKISEFYKRERQEVDEMWPKMLEGEISKLIDQCGFFIYHYNGPTEGWKRFCEWRRSWEEGQHWSDVSKQLKIKNEKLDVDMKKKFEKLKSQRDDCSGGGGGGGGASTDQQDDGEPSDGDNRGDREESDEDIFSQK